MASALSAKHLHDEAAAYRWVEARVWPDGRVCPHCGVVGESGALNGKSTRIGTYKCYACRKPFTVKVGTIFEKSHVKLHIWLQAMHIMASSKKGFSSNQFARTLGVDLKTAWFMSHRIRLAMAPGGALPPLGGAGKVVEVDETYHGKASGETRLRKDGKPRKTKGQGARGFTNKRPIVALVERGGSARTFHVAEANLETVARILRENVDKRSKLHTDGATMYRNLGKEFADHQFVDHSRDEYVRYEESGEVVHNNSAEGYFSIFKRGMKGVYQHCSEKHLHRYLSEYEFRFNNRVALGVDDHARAEKLLAGVVGKRLTYQTTSRPAQ